MLNTIKWAPSAFSLQIEVLHREKHVASPEATAGGWEQGGPRLFIADSASVYGGASVRNATARGEGQGIRTRTFETFGTKPGTVLDLEYSSQ